MKKFMSGMLVGLLISTSCIAYAYSEQTINAIFGKVKLVVEGKQVDKETLLYNGTTYVPLRAAGEVLGKSVSYDAETYTAYIGGSNAVATTPTTNTNTNKEVKEGIERDVDVVSRYPSSGSIAWTFKGKFKITSAEEVSSRNAKLGYELTGKLTGTDYVTLRLTFYDKDGYVLEQCSIVKKAPDPSNVKIKDYLYVKMETLENAERMVVIE